MVKWWQATIPVVVEGRVSVGASIEGKRQRWQVTISAEVEGENITANEAILAVTQSFGYAYDAQAEPIVQVRGDKTANVRVGQVTTHMIRYTEDSYGNGVAAMPMPML